MLHKWRAMSGKRSTEQKNKEQNEQKEIEHLLLSQDAPPPSDICCMSIICTNSFIFNLRQNHSNSSVFISNLRLVNNNQVLMGCNGFL